jgi:hypothetical protein
LAWPLSVVSSFRCRGAPAPQASGASLGHRRNEVVEQWGHIVRPRARLGMALEAEGRLLAVADALQGAIEQGAMGRDDLRRQVVSSTAKPWFWLEIMTRPVARSCTG